MMGSQARRQKTMIDHAKHNTLKQCATRQCCRQESRWEQPGQSTRQPGLALLHEFETTNTTLSNQTGQASVGHGRALFLSQFSLQRRPHSKTRAKRCPGWAPDKTGPSHCHTAQCRCRSRFRYNTVMSMSLEGKTWKSRWRLTSPSCCNERFHDQTEVEHVTDVSHKRKTFQARQKLDTCKVDDITTPS